MAIGTRNKGLKAPPEWATPDDAETGDHLSLYENGLGEQWVFLHRGGEVLLSGSDIDWETHRKSVAILGNLEDCSAIDLISHAGTFFGLQLGLSERMWLASCILAVSSRRALARRELEHP